MYIFTCDNTFEDMMCCIYHAWEKALKVGHGCVRLEKRGEEQISLFDEYIYVEYNEEEYQKALPLLRLQMKALIARDLWDMNEYYHVINDANESIRKALELLEQPDFEGLLLKKR